MSDVRWIRGRFSSLPTSAAQLETRLPVMLMGHLNLIRPLGLASVPSVVVVTSETDIALRSRYVVGYCLLPGLAPRQAPDSIERLVAAGSEISSRFGRRVPLLYGSDEALSFIHQFRDRLERSFLLLLNDDALAQALTDKEAFYRRCHSLGLLVPRTVLLSSCTAADREGFPYPAILKPRTKVGWQEMKRRVFSDDSKALLIDRPEQLDDPALQPFRDDLVLCQHIPGDDRQLYSFHGFADEHGKIISWFTGRKIRTYPPLTGESSFIELVRDPSLTAIGQSFVSRLGVRGPFKVDLKKSSADGLYYGLEINARYNLWHYLGAVAGVNLPAVAYHHLLRRDRGGLPLAGSPGDEQGATGDEPLHFRTGYRWLNMYLDCHIARSLHRRGQLPYSRWLWSLVGRNLYSTFAWDDPLPFLTWLRGALLHRVLG